MKNFDAWMLSESFGEGTEDFTEKLDMYGKLRNVTIFGTPSAWGEDIEEATGSIDYSAELEVNNWGIEGIIFVVKKITLDLDIRVYKDKEDQDGEIVNKTIVFSDENKNIEKLKIEVGSLPYYVESVDIDFTNAENLDGEVEWNKVGIEVTIGSQK